jgi:CRP/FNR family cyclic AMP-dependent transcriptional regulator
MNDKATQAQDKDGNYQGGVSMLPAPRLEAVENHHKRSRQPRRKSGILSSEVANRLAAFAIPVCHPKGAVLFAEGQPARGIFVLCTGRVKLFTSSADGKTFILRFAEPGEMLGLAGTLSGQPYEAWAETTQPTQTSFVERRHLVHIMRHHGDAAMQVAMQLGESYCSAIAGVRVLGFSRSASQKLAVYLLDWWKCNRPLHEEAGVRFTSTHEEIAHVIGISRETVTRLLSGFKKQGLIQWKGCNLVLSGKAALQSSVAN